jgi:hypothetical protein
MDAGPVHTVIYSTFGLIGAITIGGAAIGQEQILTDLVHTTIQCTTVLIFTIAVLNTTLDNVGHIFRVRGVREVLTIGNVRHNVG